MKAVRLHRYEERPAVEEVAEPEARGPSDVVVRVGGAGLCRTDLHIIEGQWAEKSNVALPYTMGHENAGWIHAVGSGGARAARRRGDPAPAGDVRALPGVSGR